MCVLQAVMTITFTDNLFVNYDYNYDYLSLITNSYDEKP